MAAKNPATTKPKIAPVAVKLPAAAVVADAPPAFEPTQAVSAKPEAAPAVPFVAAPKAVEPKKKPAPAPAPVAPADAIPVTTTVETAAPIAPEKPAQAEEKKMDTTTTTASIENAGAQIADKAKTMFADAGAKGKAAFTDMNDFTKGNLEAIVESGKIAAKGVEMLGQDAAEYGRRQFESATAALKNLSTVKSPTDFFKLQGDYARTSFDAFVAHTSQSTEKMLKLAGDVAQPIQNRVSVAVEKVKLAA